MIEVDVERCAGRVDGFAQARHLSVAFARGGSEIGAFDPQVETPARSVEGQARVGRQPLDARVPCDLRAQRPRRQHPGHGLALELETAEQGDQGALRGRGQEDVVGQHIPECARGADVGDEFDAPLIPAYKGVGAFGRLRARAVPFQPLGAVVALQPTWRQKPRWL